MSDLAVTDAVIDAVVSGFRSAAADLDGRIPEPATGVFGRGSIGSAVDRSLRSEDDFRREIRRRVRRAADGVETGGDEYGTVDSFLKGLT